GRVALLVGGGAAAHTRLAPDRAPRLLPKPPALLRGRARFLRPRRTRRRKAPLRDGRAPPPVVAQPGLLQTLPRQALRLRPHADPASAPARSPRSPRHLRLAQRHRH